ncbi:hypothetical protein KEM56_000366, partial [Ascosphaera pollenicola]
MPRQAAARPQGHQAAQPQQQEEEQGGSTFKSIIQNIALFIALQWVMSSFFGSKQRAASVGGNSSGAGGQPLGGPVPTAVPPFGERPVDQDAITNKTHVPFNVAPMWGETSALDITVYVSGESALPYLTMAKEPEVIKVVEEKNFKMGDFDEKRELDGSFKVPASVQNNGT